MRTLSPSFALLVCLLVLASCNRPEPIKIGLAVNLSGEGGAAGEDIRTGAMIAVSEINDRGGVKGRRMELLVKDDRNTPEGVLDADRALAEAGAVAIIGHSTSQNTLSAYPFITSMNVLLFAPYTATTMLTGKDDFVVRSAVDTKQYGKALGHILDQRGVKKAAFLLDLSNKTYCEEYLAETTRNFAGMAQPVRIDSRMAIQWDEAIKDLLEGTPDAVVLLTEVMTTGITAQKLRLADFKGQMYATIWAQTPALTRFGGKAVEGIRLISFLPPMDDSPAFLNLSAKTSEKFHQPASARTVRAYEAVSILAQAMEQCIPGLDAACLKKALSGHEFDGFFGKVSFDEYGDVDRPVYEIEIRGDKENIAAEVIPGV